MCHYRYPHSHWFSFSLLQLSRIVMKTFTMCGRSSTLQQLLCKRQPLFSQETSVNWKNAYSELTVAAPLWRDFINVNYAKSSTKCLRLFNYGRTKFRSTPFLKDPEKFFGLIALLFEVSSSRHRVQSVAPNFKHPNFKDIFEQRTQLIHGALLKHCQKPFQGNKLRQEIGMQTNRTSHVFYSNRIFGVHHSTTYNTKKLSARPCVMNKITLQHLHSGPI